MSIAVPLYGFGASGGSPNKSTIIVTAPTGSTVTCKMGSITKTAPEKNGVWTFGGLDLGTWTLTATKGSDTTTQDVAITRLTVEYVTLAYRMTPEFTYTGDYAIVDDSDNPISDFANWKNNWKIRFLTSGTFTVTKLNGWDGRLDVFLVGGGGAGGAHSGDFMGGGGGGGYTTTKRAVIVQVNMGYKIVVGGISSNAGANGGDSSAFNQTAKGGKGGATHNGSNGGSGGGVGGNSNDGNYQASVGGTDGSDGKKAYRDGVEHGTPGTGQGTTTAEFGESGKKLYSPGGDGGSYQNNRKTIAGAGGQGQNRTDDEIRGQAGIAIIRNTRGAA